MSSFSCTGSVLYNAPERRESKKVKIIMKFSLKIYNKKYERKNLFFLYSLFILAEQIFIYHTQFFVFKKFSFFNFLPNIL